MKPSAIIESCNRSHFAWIVQTYASLVAQNAEMTQSFIEDLECEDDAMRPYDSISTNRVLEICSEYAKLQFI